MRRALPTSAISARCFAATLAYRLGNGVRTL